VFDEERTAVTDALSRWTDAPSRIKLLACTTFVTRLTQLVQLVPVTALLQLMQSDGDGARLPELEQG
jgi:hypothetical protein